MSEPDFERQYKRQCTTSPRKKKEAKRKGIYNTAPPQARESPPPQPRPDMLPRMDLPQHASHTIPPRDHMLPPSPNSNPRRDQGPPQQQAPPSQQQQQQPPPPSQPQPHSAGGEKKTRGRVRIRMEFISNKLRRYTTFSKRKTGIMKKAYELSTLTGTQVMLLVASETGHVYTFATPKLQPMITSETGKALIQTCLNSPDPPPPNRNPDERMSQTGYEETELAYPVNEEEQDTKAGRENHMYNNSNDPNLNSGSPPHSYTGMTMQHDSYPMNMSFIPATTAKPPETSSGQTYSMSVPPLSQQQLGSFETIFPPPGNYPPRTMPGGMTHEISTHLVRMPENMNQGGEPMEMQSNMVSIQPNSNSQQQEEENRAYLYNRRSSRSSEGDVKHRVVKEQVDSDTEERDNGDC